MTRCDLVELIHHNISQASELYLNCHHIFSSNHNCNYIRSLITVDSSQRLKFNLPTNGMGLYVKMNKIGFNQLPKGKLDEPCAVDSIGVIMILRKSRWCYDTISLSEFHSTFYTVSLWISYVSSSSCKHIITWTLGNVRLLSPIEKYHDGIS